MTLAEVFDRICIDPVYDNEECMDTIKRYAAKEEKYAWHDLRKNPEDLPEELKKVYVYFEYFRYGDFNCMYKDYGVSYQIGGMFHFVNGSSGWRELKIIAWRYIEPFEEDE